MGEYGTSLSDVKRFVEAFHGSDIDVLAFLAHRWDDMVADLAAGEDLAHDDFVVEGRWVVAGVVMSLEDVLAIAGRMADG